jgi:hypothetical protein
MEYNKYHHKVHNPESTPALYIHIATYPPFIPSHLLTSSKHKKLADSSRLPSSFYTSTFHLISAHLISHRPV